MSIPRNHHYISQVHIKNFFNHERSKIFLYDKLSENHFSRISTKSIFSEKDLNSKFEDGSLDHAELEEDLNINFEKDFNKHFKIIHSYLMELEYSDEVTEALFYFARYGVIGNIRNPSHKDKIEKMLDTLRGDLFVNCVEDLQREIDDSFLYREKTKYINSSNYSEFADNVLDLMGDLIFRIEIAVNKDDYFLLPDFCAANRRKKINTYFNPDVKEIAYIGFPLSSKIYLHFYSSKDKSANPNSGIYPLNRSIVDQLNKINFDYSKGIVACESEDYIKYFIENIA